MQPFFLSCFKDKHLVQNCPKIWETFFSSGGPIISTCYRWNCRPWIRFYQPWVLKSWAVHPSQALPRHFIINSESQIEKKSKADVTGFPEKKTPFLFGIAQNTPAHFGYFLYCLHHLIECITRITCIPSIMCITCTTCITCIICINCITCSLVLLVSLISHISLDWLKIRKNTHSYLGRDCPQLGQCP